MAEPLLEVRDLTVLFGGNAAVSGLSLEVRHGETVCVVGESGSGKSVSSLAAMGLLPRTARIVSGSIRFDGRELIGLPTREMRSLRGKSLAMIFQEPMTSLNPVLTVGRQITEVLERHEGMSRRQARARAVELLDLVRIPDPRRRVSEYPHNLSGGMRQRVMIALAVACRPRLLIADEPTTALDVTIQAQVLELIDTLRSQLSMAVLLVTHDLGVVSQWADRVVVMYAGRKVEQAGAGDLFRQPRHPYTQGLLAASPRVNAGFSYRDGLLPEIPGSIDSARREKGCPFAPRCPAVVGICRAVMPPETRLGDGRTVACHVAAQGGTMPGEGRHAAVVG